MVQFIMDTEDTLLERLDKAVNEKGADRMNVQEVGMLTDALKDLAETEYYMTVTEAMDNDSMGYEGDMGMQGNSQGGGYRRGYDNGRRGYRGQSRDSMGRYSRRGYRQGRYGHDDVMQDVKDMMMSADPQEKEQIKQKLRQMADM